MVLWHLFFLKMCIDTIFVVEKVNISAQAILEDYLFRATVVSPLCTKAVHMSILQNRLCIRMISRLGKGSLESGLLLS